MGKGSGSSVNVVVTTKPRFVKKLPADVGVPIHRKKVWLTCIVECSPLCSIRWYRNSSLLSNSIQYQVQQLPAMIATLPHPDVQMVEAVRLKDYRTNTLSSVESHLIFSIPRWRYFQALWHKGALQGSHLSLCHKEPAKGNKCPS